MHGVLKVPTLIAQYITKVLTLVAPYITEVSTPIAHFSHIYIHICITYFTQGVQEAYVSQSVCF